MLMQKNLCVYYLNPRTVRGRVAQPVVRKTHAIQRVARLMKSIADTHTKLSK